MTKITEDFSVDLDVKQELIAAACKSVPNLMDKESDYVIERTTISAKGKPYLCWSNYIKGYYYFFECTDTQVKNQPELVFLVLKKMPKIETAFSKGSSVFKYEVHNSNHKKLVFNIYGAKDFSYDIIMNNIYMPIVSTFKRSMIEETDKMDAGGNTVSELRNRKFITFYTRALDSLIGANIKFVYEDTFYSVPSYKIKRFIHPEGEENEVLSLSSIPVHKLGEYVVPPF